VEHDDGALPDGAPTDADLARTIGAALPGGAGDAEAELYRRLVPRVRLYGLRHLRDGQAAADLAQQVLLMTIESLRAGRVREPERLASFVLGACQKIVQDQRRGQARRQQLLDRFPGDVPVAGEWQVADLDAERLRVCLERLAARERSVVVMSFYDERSASEVAAETGLSPGNVRVIRHRALGRLRACLTGEVERP
jgi:RNA polymerase sigma-70 factor (ECF subfamily)